MTPVKFMEVSSATVYAPGAAATDITYPHINLVLTTGTWFVVGSAAIASNVGESYALGIFDGIRVVVQGSPGHTAVAANPVCLTAFGFVAVKSQMTLWLRAMRNGGSTMTIGTGAAMNPSQRLLALKVL